MSSFAGKQLSPKRLHPASHDSLASSFLAFSNILPHTDPGTFLPVLWPCYFGKNEPHSLNTIARLCSQHSLPRFMEGTLLSLCVRVSLGSSFPLARGLEVCLLGPETSAGTAPSLATSHGWQLLLVHGPCYVPRNHISPFSVSETSLRSSRHQWK